MTDKKHNHYFKDVNHLDTSYLYSAVDSFDVTDPCLQHAIKKLLVAGGRGAGKCIDQDIQEAIDTLIRCQEMRSEEVENSEERSTIIYNPIGKKL